MNRAIVLHVRVATKRLPVRVLNPTRDDRFIGLVERVFEIVQADHQTRRFARGAVVIAIAFGEHQIALIPIDVLGNLHQRVLGIEQLIKVSLEEFECIVRLWLRLHP